MIRSRFSAHSYHDLLVDVEQVTLMPLSFLICKMKVGLAIIFPDYFRVLKFMSYAILLNTFQVIPTYLNESGTTVVLELRVI